MRNARTAPHPDLNGKWGCVMGFMFRLCFWLGVTIAIMPPDERPGEALGGESAAVTLDERFAETVQSAWALVSQVSMACEQNPQLCAATAALAQTAAETGQSIASAAQPKMERPEQHRPKAEFPVDAPVPEAHQDGRVGRGESPAG
jgi:hypothetical protein